MHLLLSRCNSHKALFPGDQLGFDLTTFKAQLSRLVLPSQEISITVRMIVAQEEDDLAIGLHTCRRQFVDADSSSTSSSFKEIYLNSRCILSYIEHFDDEMYLNYADDIKAQHSSHPDFKQKHYKSTLHIVSITQHVEKILSRMFHDNEFCLMTDILCIIYDDIHCSQFI